MLASFIGSHDFCPETKHIFPYQKCKIQWKGVVGTKGTLWIPTKEGQAITFSRHLETLKTLREALYTKIKGPPIEASWAH